MKNLQFSLWAMMVLSQLGSYAIMATDCHDHDVSKRLCDCLSFCGENLFSGINDTAHEIHHYCYTNKKQMTALLLLGLSVAAGSQNSTEPTPGVDAYAGYWWTIFGGVSSIVGGVAGLVATVACDFLVGYFYENRAEERVHEFIIDALEKLRMDIGPSEKNKKNEERLMAAVIDFLILNNGIDESRAEELVRNWLKSEEMSFHDFVSSNNGNTIIDNNDCLISMKPNKNSDDDSSSSKT
jgi:hypothetical protein